MCAVRQVSKGYNAYQLYYIICIENSYYALYKLNFYQYYFTLTFFLLKRKSDALRNCIFLPHFIVLVFCQSAIKLQ